ncbi:MAG: inorganic diphosphatase [Deltaproteobacteria bacterium]
MSRVALRRIVVLVLFSLASPQAARATDWKDRFDFSLAPGYRLVPGDYTAGVPDTLLYVPDETLNLYTDLAAVNPDGTINAVIEIPQGDVRKFETDVSTGRLFWELKNGQPRTVAYLGYPGNYGMVPRTLGGDGDPLDIVVIGRTELRGAIAAAKVVAVMRMIDGGDPDDKLIAVVPGSPFDGKSLADLEGSGVTAILKAWFESYKGPGEIQVTAFEGEAVAAQVLADAAATYEATPP